MLMVEFPKKEMFRTYQVFISYYCRLYNILRQQKIEEYLKEDIRVNIK